MKKHYRFSPQQIRPPVRQRYPSVDLRRMRWFVLIVISLGFLASIGVSITILILTKNPTPVVIPSSFVLILRPVIRYLFPPKENGDE